MFSFSITYFMRDVVRVHELQSCGFAKALMASLHHSRRTQASSQIC